MCRVLKVARAGFYVWLHNPVSAGEKDNQRLLELIRDSYTLSGGVYGYRRVHGDLREIGEVCSRNRVAKIMRKNRIQAIHGYKGVSLDIGNYCTLRLFFDLVDLN